MCSLDELPPTDAGQLANTGQRYVPDSEPTEAIDAGWTSYFRHDTVYKDQRKAIDSLLSTLSDGSYYLKEGACGTGKTLAAVTASVHAMRDQEQLSGRVSGDAGFPEYNRTMVVTPVKQQLQQFVDELRGINKTLPNGTEPIPTVVLRGREDMMAIKNADLQKTETQEKIQSLREHTRELIRFDSDIPLDWPDKVDCPRHSRVEYNWSDASDNAEAARDNFRFDPYRARAVRILVTQLTSKREGEYERLQINGVETPYPNRIPHTQELADIDRLQNSSSNQLPENRQGRFDPFYAATFSKPQDIDSVFKDAQHHVIDRKDLFTKAISNGRCPHELMGALAQDAEVILGNYNHLLDPETRLLTDTKLGLLDEETIVVVDEAHQLERRARERLSTSVDLYTLDRARNDVEIARHYSTGQVSNTPTPGLSPSDAQLAQKIVREEFDFSNESIDIGELIAVEVLFDIAKKELLKASDTIDDVRLAGTDERLPTSESLSSPANPQWGDHLTNAIEDHDSISTAALPMAEQVMEKLEDVYYELAEREIVERTPQGREVGSLFRQWKETPLEVYHPEARIVPSEKVSFPEKYPDWVEHWTPELRLFNCIPQRELRRVFAELGGGVLMSATLRPVDPLKQATGIDAVPYPDTVDDVTEADDDDTIIRANGITDEMLDDITTRRTAFDRFPLRFSPDNRLSLVANLDRFTQANRGSPQNDDGSPVVSRDEMTATRQEYADLIEQVAQTRGNILIAMPSYQEAAWAHAFLKTLSVGKRCLVDESSSADETDHLLETFFADRDAILCTSLRGTITEGVDFEGETLHTCLNIGVPLAPNNSQMEAVEVAYQSAVDSAGGREAAQLIPSTRKVRQSVGRVIRGAQETGVRIIVDKRYVTAETPNLRQFLSPQQQQEFTPIEPTDIEDAISRFWAEHG